MSGELPVKIAHQLTKANALDILNKRNVLSDSGTDWLKLALDPFHDNTVAIAGMPDADAGDSVVQVFKQKISITKPTNFVAGKWDAHICVLPMQDSPTPIDIMGNGTNLYQGTAGIVKPSTSYIPGGIVGLPELGTVVVNTAASGKETWPGPDMIAGGTVNNWGGNFEFDSHSYVPETGEVSPMSKIIGGGFEVHNDTEMLNKGGSVTMYCMPQARYDNLVTQLNAGPITDINSINESVTIRQPPSSPQEAQNFPNSRTLSAKDGCYVPFYIDTNNSQFECHTSKVLRTRRDEARDDLSVVGTGTLTPGVIASSLVRENNLALGAQNLKMASLETCGAYFTGLSEETVLTLTVRYVVESRPTASNAQMLSLASQTAMYDPLALELYRTIRALMPVGVPVNFNAKGDWFRMAMSHVGDALLASAPIVSLLGPEFGAIAVAAGTAARTLSSIGKKSVPGRATTDAQKKAPRAIAAKR